MWYKNAIIYLLPDGWQLEARADIGYAYRVTRYNTDNYYPVWTWYAGWKYAIPIDTATMTEITELPK